MTDSIITVKDIQSIKNGIGRNLSKVDLDWESRRSTDSIVNGLDKLLEEHRDISSTKFNRILFSHILEFQSIDPTKPILVSDFINSYFLVYDSMKENKSKYASKCKAFLDSINDAKSLVGPLSNSEKLEQDGRTSTSCMRAELKLIQIFQDNPDNMNLDAVFSRCFISIVAAETSTEYIKIPLSKSTLNNKPTFEFPLKNLNEKLHIIYIDEAKRINKILEEFYPRDCYDFYIPKSYEIEDKGYLNLDLIYVNSRLNFWNKKIAEYEESYQEAHVTYDNLSSGIILLEEPFTDFMIVYNKNKRDENDNNPGETDLGQKPPGYSTKITRKEVEISEKIENAILGVSGKKCIVWETIYFLFNKIMLGCLIVVLLYRGDYASVSTILIYYSTVHSWNSWSRTRN